MSRGGESLSRVEGSQGGFCPGGFCPGGLCPGVGGVSVQGWRVSVQGWGSLFRGGGSLSRVEGSLSRGVSVRETPHMVKSG